MTEPMTPKDLLLGAIKRIENHGWGQGLYLMLDGRSCLVGALHRAAGYEWFLDGPVQRAYLDALDTVQAVINGRPAGAAQRLGIEIGAEAWNDSPGRTEEEVINALRTAADRL